MNETSQDLLPAVEAANEQSQNIEHDQGITDRLAIQHPVISHVLYHMGIRCSPHRIPLQQLCPIWYKRRAECATDWYREGGQAYEPEHRRPSHADRDIHGKGFVWVQHDDAAAASESRCNQEDVDEVEPDILAPQDFPYSMEDADVEVAEGFLAAFAGGAGSGELECFVSEPAGSESLDHGCGVICLIDQHMD